VAWQGPFPVAANGRAELARLSPARAQGVWLISYSLDNGSAGHKTGTNHYLYGEPPFRLSDYRSWLDSPAAGDTALITP
jgi:beta-mannosidase